MLAVSLIGFAKSKGFEVLFKMFAGLVGFGLLHGPTLCSNENIIAFVGGGGKTTLSLALSREISESLRSCVLISTTTKMFQARIPEDCDVVVMGT